MCLSGERPSKFYLISEEPDLTLDPNTGMLRTRLPLDRETRDRYILSVELRNGILSSYCQVSLFVKKNFHFLRDYSLSVIFLPLYNYNAKFDLIEIF